MSNPLDALREEGQLERRGTFDLDESKAKSKMQQFQLADPYRYVLEFVQVAHLMGATRIDVRVDHNEVEIVYAGEAIEAHEMEDIYAAAFRARHTSRDHALRHMAIGWSVAHGMNPAQLELDMFHPNGAARLSVKKGEDVVEALSVGQGGVFGGRFYVRKRLRLEMVSDFFFHHVKRGDLHEAQVLKTHVMHSSIPIRVNGELVSHGMRLTNPSTSYVVSLLTQTARGFMGFFPDDVDSVRPSQLSMHQHGVWVQHYEDPKALWSYEGIVESSALSKDLSQGAFVQDAQWRKLTGQTIPEALCASVTLWLEQYWTGNGFDFDDNIPLLRKVQSFMWRLMSHDVNLRAECEEEEYERSRALETLLHQLEYVPILNVANSIHPNIPRDYSGKISIRVVRMHAGERLYFSRSDVLDVFIKDVPIALTQDNQLSLLEGYLGYAITDCTRRLLTAQQAQINRSHWEHTPHVETLFEPGSLAVEAPSDDLRVSWRWSFDRKTFYIKDAHLLRMDTHTFDSPFLAHLMIGGELVANIAFDGIQRNAAYQNALLCAYELFPGLMERVAKTQGTACREELLTYINMVCESSLVNELSAWMDLTRAFTSSSRFTSWHRRVCAKAHPSALSLGQMHGSTLDSYMLPTAVKKLGEVAHARLFARVNGQWASLAEILDELQPEESGRLAYVHANDLQLMPSEELSASDVDSDSLVGKHGATIEQQIIDVSTTLEHMPQSLQRVLLLDDLALSVLSHLMPNAKLKDCAEEWSKHMLNAMLLAIDPVESLTLPRSSMMTQGWLKKPGLDALVRIVDIDYTNENDLGLMTLHWFKDKRPLGTSTTYMLFGRVTCAVEYAPSSANASLNGVDDVQEMTRQVSNEVTAYASMLLIAWVHEGIEAQRHLNEPLFWRRLVGVMVNVLHMRTWDDSLAEHLGTLEDLPLFQSNRGNMSLNEIADMVRQGRVIDVAFIQGMRPTSVAQSRHLVLSVPLGAGILTLLNTLFRLKGGAVYEDGQEAAQIRPWSEEEVPSLQKETPTPKPAKPDSTAPLTPRPARAVVPAEARASVDAAPPKIGLIVRDLLMRVRGNARVLLSDGFFERMDEVSIQGHTALIESSRIQLNITHPAMILVQEHPNDLIAQALLASSVYSAINRYDEAITDEHEVKFHRLWLCLMVSELFS